MKRSFNYYVEGHVFEWVMSGATFLLAIEFLLWPDIVEASAFHFLLRILPQNWLTALMFFLGWCRLCALMLNGQRIFGIKMGPVIRACCGVVSGILWVEFTLALVLLFLEKGVPSPGIPFWFMFTLGEIYAAFTTVKNG